MIVRWGLRELPTVLAELRIAEPLLIASGRWDDQSFGIRPAARWTEVPSDRIAEAAEHAGDGVVAVGGGSAIDLGKAISAEAEVPLVSVPTTYAGAEWTPFFGIRDPERKMKGGGSGAHLRGAVYEPELTLSLPREETVGTALNALAHCAEAMYAEGHNALADEHALTGARQIGEWLPRVVEAPTDLEARTKLLEPVDRRRCLRREDLDELAVGRLVRGLPDVRSVLFRRIVVPEGRLDAALRLGGIARLQRAFGRHRDARARSVCGDGGRQTGGAAADHEHVKEGVRHDRQTLPGRTNPCD